MYHKNALHKRKLNDLVVGRIHSTHFFSIESEYDLMFAIKCRILQCMQFCVLDFASIRHSISCIMCKLN